MNRSLVGAAGAALVAGLATLAVSVPQPASAQEEFRVTAAQLKINQRISQAAVRRANEALTRLDAIPAPPAQNPAAPAQPLPPAPLTNDVVVVASDVEVVPPGQSRTAELPCSGQMGAASYTLTPTAVGLVYEWAPRPGGGWLASFRNDGTDPATLTLRGSCRP